MQSSHTWERGEVSFQDIANLEQAKTKPGFSKIERTCQLAFDHGITYAWVDTCCIDKSSSAELTEAINSMFRWYKNAEICFVYLSDLPVNSDDGYLPRCRWFTRGWTLQELIASKNSKFLDQNWNVRGTKVSLERQISNITGIETEILENSEVLHIIPVARRMYWAASRRTTRIEDLAYCLFGIFDVNLPLIYGEGAKAFIRLQEAIAQENNDLSLFAWTSQNEDQDIRGIFARSPAEFRGCGHVCRITDPGIPAAGFSMTNRGIHIESRLTEGENDYLLNLECYDSNTEQAERAIGIIVIRLKRTTHGYVRHGSNKIVVVSRSRLQPIEAVPVHIPKVISRTGSRLLEFQLSQRFSFKVINTSGFICEITKRPAHLWESQTQTFITDGHENFTGLLEIVLRRLRQDPFVSRARRYGFVSEEDGLVEHSSTYIAAFGLEKHDHLRTRDAFEAPIPLQPWATIYERGEKDTKVVSKILGFLSQEDNKGFPYVLEQIRSSVRSRTFRGEVLPGVLILAPIWQRNNTYVKEYLPRDQTDWTSNLSRFPDQFAEGPHLRIDLSAKRTENKSNGMYELVLKIENET
jgi:hypothetical protein